jgi:hypothetical protein
MVRVVVDRPMREDEVRPLGLEQRAESIGVLGVYDRLAVDLSRI